SNKTSVTLSGACETGLNVSLSVDDSVNTPATAPVTSSSACTSNSWSQTLNLSTLNDGGLTATVFQTDLAGNAGTASKTAGKDVLIPSCTISQAGTTLSAVCADVGSGCTGNPSNQTITADGTYTFNVADNAGNPGSCSITEYAHYTYTWSACGSFGAWNTSTHTRTGTQTGTVASTTYNTTSPSDPTAPSQSCTETDADNPTIDTFDVNPKITNSSIFLSFAGSDVTGTVRSGVNHYEIWRGIYNASTCATGTEGSACSWVQDGANTTGGPVTRTPAEGVYWYGVHVVDNSGRLGTESAPVKVTIDKTNPTCTASLGGTNGTVASATCADLGGSNCTGNPANQSVTAAGTYTFSVVDNAGNSGSCSVVAYVHYAYNPWTACGSFGAWNTSTYTHTGTQTRTVATTYYNTSSPSDSQVLSQSCTETDDANPVVASFSVSPTVANSSGPNVSISFAGTDTAGAVNSGVDHYEIWRTTDQGGSPYAAGWVQDGANTIVSPQVRTAADGVYWYGLHVVDVSGRLGTESAPIKVTFDTVSPATPAVNGTTPTKNQKPTWSWTSGGGGNGTYRYRLDNSDLSTGSTTTTTASYTPATNLSEGSHTLYVQEADAAGNWSASGSQALVVDITNPTAGACSFSPAGWTYGNVTASVAFTDSSGVVAPTTKTCSISTAGGACSVTAQDNAANSTTASCSATNIDKTAPQITAWGLNNSITNALITKDYPIFTWQVSDSGAGIRSTDGVELWRAPYVAGTCDGVSLGGCDWSGNPKKKFGASSTGGSDDTLGTTSGKYVYGLHVVDSTVAPNPPGNCIAESKAHCGGVTTDSLDASRSSFSPFVVTYDIAPPPPPVVSEAPVSNSTTPTNRPRFTLTATDSDGIATITVTLRCTGNPAATVHQPWCDLAGSDDPLPMVKNCAGLASCDFSQEFTRKVGSIDRPLSNGVYTVILGVVDLAGNSWTDSWPFTVSNVKPQPPTLR
ncbi:MAG: hypothetical protein HY974_00630, partial [Candidatus Kerfeldbacteria bacterium]|nr:hypothetical protein [Candidatus Kerfeldbacteria bacterium]